MKTELNQDVTAALAGLSGKSLRQVFLVACGGSLSIMHPGKYFLDQQSKTINADVFNADEFVCRCPLRLDQDALVILCSQTGTTKETTQAAEFARSKGATTIAMTLDPGSPLAAAAEHVVTYQASYTTGKPIDAAESNYGVLYMLLAGLVKLADGHDLTEILLRSLSNLQTAIDRAHADLAPIFDDYAPRLAKKRVIHTLSAGADYGAAYSFSICVLMEMQRIDSHPIHADEYFHGPFEVTDADAAFVILIGLGQTRRLSQRARDFALRFGDKDAVMVLDAEKLDLNGIDELLRPYLVPLVFFDALWRFAYRLADLRDIPMLEGRRYMKKLTNY